MGKYKEIISQALRVKTVKEWRRGNDAKHNESEAMNTLEEKRCRVQRG